MANDHQPPAPGAQPAEAVVEAYHGGAWHRVGRVRVRNPARGISSPSSFEYELEYLDGLASAIGARDRRAVSCRYPVGYEVFDEQRWPPFLLDVIPSGAARRHWEQRLGVPSNDGSDWTVLTSGASHPPGNLRIAGAVESAHLPTVHPGFPRSDILERAEGFIEYAHQCGAPVSGSSGAGGDSPKFLLREDHQGRWHADGALADERTRGCWLVKFPRTRDRSDRLILEAEAGYHRVASRCGLRTFGEVSWERDCLFVPRFDRLVRRVAAGGEVDRLGLESLCSLAGVAEFGALVPKERQAAAIARHTDDPISELMEFLRRDVLDVALGNTDNHARNTSLLKDATGHVALAPLYDFAPMILDERGIARVCRWADQADYPRWDLVAGALSDLGLDGRAVRTALRQLAHVVGALPEVMRDGGVPDLVIERCQERIGRVATALSKVTP